ncbi:Arc family DNA-binding protein [Paraburkholderia sp. SARCC-3016]|uniref:Arc family DNA-binding protein n=1 Tax=Paraburkholderia sp. SARCC-3016 TaxID=3058611 RepID=UPI0028089B65|nr:Arc family DNA-binding protein [Paraburkholderia sp. SARCC-3016]MDQ7978711.1 Arc family DNA-binding protein [Paraburkholderia sp. SARCC-3016]
MNTSWTTVVPLSTPPWSIIIAHMTREDPQIKLRLPAELKDVLTDAAQENGRSLNAEVVKRLEESVEAGPHGRPVQVDPYTLDLFAEKVGQVLDARDKRRKKP